MLFKSKLGRESLYNYIAIDHIYTDLGLDDTLKRKITPDKLETRGHKSIHLNV